MLQVDIENVVMPLADHAAPPNPLNVQKNLLTLSSPLRLSPTFTIRFLVITSDYTLDLNYSR